MPLDYSKWDSIDTSSSDDERPEIPSVRTTVAPNSVAMHVHAFGDREMLIRPCVDCGLETGSYCETLSAFDGELGVCPAVRWMPTETWSPGQCTPFCAVCEARYGACHFCREVPSCTPPRHQEPVQEDTMESRGILSRLCQHRRAT